jgi:regulator of protease activity HflC (stomatin/prohibitin superfamily)
MMVQKPNPAKSAGKIVISVFITLFLLFIVVSMVYTVPAGHVGVYDLFGVVKDKAIYPGLHVKNPFATVNKMSVKTKDYTMTIVEGEGAVSGVDSISALSREGLTVDLDVTVWFKLNWEKAAEIYKRVGTNYVDVLVRPKVREAIRAVTAKYDAKTIYSEDRAQLQTEIEAAIAEDLDSRGVIIEKVLLRNVRLPDKVRNAIEEKLQAEQEAQRMTFILDRERQEAERKRVEAQGISDANKVISGSLSENYLRWYWITNLENHEDVIYIPIGQDGMPIFKEI